MATTLTGPSGHSVPSHVTEEVNIARGNATIHNRQMVEMTAEKWDKLLGPENVTHKIVQVEFPCQILKRNLPSYSFLAYTRIVISA